MTPLFIGSGKSIGKKEYAFSLKDKKVYIPDIKKLYEKLYEKKIAPAFIKYIQDPRADDLLAWLEQNKVKTSEFEECLSYVLDANDGIIKEKERYGNRIVEKLANKEIAAFLKDAYGNPYVPGSSVKGALRSIILHDSIAKNKAKFSSDAASITTTISKSSLNPRKDLTSRSIESKILHKLNRPGTESKDMVNSVMSGLIVGDSAPLSVKDLILCQKVDLSAPKINDGKASALNILRECIRPGTEIEVDLTIDTTIFPYGIDDLRQMINAYNEDYQAIIVSSFEKTDTPYVEKAFYLGGGTGYPLKTIMYSLYEKKEAVRNVSKILSVMFPKRPKRDHKHEQDVSIGISPHILKCTKLNGKLYEMGKCEISII
ncbi:MAG: type III-A CRISPR-associated RAMP protein Csm5 [Fusobacteriaceae bacterium]|nr:type III-A CRISPR-associated RAMP protein Csm5 [Fusobacteriaceae bacterium]